MWHKVIVRAGGSEMGDDAFRSEAEAISHAELLVRKLSPDYAVAVIECQLVSDHYAGRCQFYAQGTGAELY